MSTSNARSASERESLLGSQSSRSSHGASAVHGDAHPVSRWLGALSAGSLPSNDQLFTALHRTAGALDALTSAAEVGVDGEPLATASSSSPTAGAQRTAQLVFQESASLCRDLGRWITRPDTEVDVEIEEPTDKGNADGTTSTTSSKQRIKVPNGNSREQIQRVIYHARNTRVEVHAEIPGADEAQRAAKQASDAAQQVGEDASDLFGAASRLALMVLSSDQIQAVSNDLLFSLRESLADPLAKAHDVAAILQEKSGAAADALRPTEEERAHPAPIAELPARAKETVAQTAQQVADAEPAELKAKQRTKESEQDEDATIDYASERLASLLDDLNSDPSSANAMETILHICKRYAQQGALFVRAAHDTASLDGAGLRIDSDALQLQANKHLERCFRAGAELLEGLAGGASLRPIQARARALAHAAAADEDVQQWITDVADLCQETVDRARMTTAAAWSRGGTNEGQAEGSTSAAERLRGLKDRIKHLLQRGRDLLRSKPTVQSEAQQLMGLLDEFKVRILRDERNATIRARIMRIFDLVKLALRGGARAAKREWKEFMGDMLSAILPSAFGIFKILPVPKVEFTSDKLDAVVDHIAIPTVNLIPDSVNVQSAHDYTWRRHSDNSDVTSAVKLTVSGLRFALNDISFYVQERYTAPAPTACGGCCGCGATRRCGGGPSEWLAYEERALLDVGFEKEGVSATVDLQTIKTESNEEEEARTHFFEVRDTSLDVSHSFVFNLRHSRHWILNALLLGIAKPTIRLVLERIGAAQLQHGVELIDGKIFDIYARARYNAWDRHHKRGELAEVHPRIWDYLRVLFSSTAGKPHARIIRERQEAEEARKEAEKQQAEEQRIIDSQPKPVKAFEIKRSAVIKNDKFGSYQIAIGLGDELLPGKSGPPPTTSGKTGSALLDGDLPEVIADHEAVRLAQGAKAMALNAGAAAAQVLVEVPEVAEAERQTQPSAKDDDLDGWRSTAFDI